MRPGKAGAASKATKSSNAGGSGVLPPSLRNPSVWQQSGAPGHSPVAINSTRNRELPQAPNSSGAASGRTGQPQGTTNRAQGGGRAGAGSPGGGRATSSQSKGSGSGASKSASGPGKGAAKTGSAATGAPERYPGLGGNPYVGLNPLLGRTFQSSNSGSDTHQGVFTGHGTPGGLTAGSERGSTQGQRASPNPVQTGQGRQLTLQSTYGAGGQSSQTTPGKGNSTSGQLRANTGSQQGGAPTADYVPPDANFVALGDRTIVSRYFVQQAAE